jgi:hypothetical protein
MWFAGALAVQDRVAAPAEEEQAGHHYRVGVGEVGAGCGVQVVKFSGAGQAHF